MRPFWPWVWLSGLLLLTCVAWGWAHRSEQARLRERQRVEADVMAAHLDADMNGMKKVLLGASHFFFR